MSTDNFEAALTAAWQKRAGAVYLQALSASDADDCLMSAYAKCLERRAEYDSARGSVEAFLAAQVKLTALSVQRDNQRRAARRAPAPEESMALDEDGNAVGVDWDDPETQALLDETAAAMSRTAARVVDRAFALAQKRLARGQNANAVTNAKSKSRKRTARG